MSLKESIVFVKLFETSFGSDIFASFTEFQCQGTDAFGSISVNTVQTALFRAACYINNAWILL